MKIYKRRKEKLEEIDELYQAFSNVTAEESGNVISDENNRICNIKIHIIFMFQKLEIKLCWI